MAFNVGDIVKKNGGVQKYKIIDVLEDSKYECAYEPNICLPVKFKFKEADIVLV